MVIDISSTILSSLGTGCDQRRQCDHCVMLTGVYSSCAFMATGWQDNAGQFWDTGDGERGGGGAGDSKAVQLMCVGCV